MKLSPRLTHYFNPARGLTIALINLSLALSRGMAWAFACSSSLDAKLP